MFVSKSQALMPKEFTKTNTNHGKSKSELYVFKNISYNILDIIAKVGVGIVIWYQVVQYKLETIDGELDTTN